MRKTIILILTLNLMSCQGEDIEPTNTPETESGNDFCKCGEIININQYPPDTFFTYTLKNHCTGNSTTVTNATYYDYGNSMCTTYTW